MRGTWTGFTGFFKIDKINSSDPVHPENLVNPVKQTSGIQAVVITASDACSRGEREDTSGKTLVQLLTDLGADIVETKILSDDLEPLAQCLKEFRRSRRCKSDCHYRRHRFGST